ncbi:MAG: MoaD family protein [Nitrososphaeria archaeon]|nr:MoaD family protein [Nitrososphaeria archaeon]NIN53354.1 MoaD family protein [Nitrososphaeria archaeon]NIQ33820.1 MoaD family protein [Nitrososphaeria archaeon]
MKVLVRFYANLREFMGKKTLELEVEEGTTFEGLLNQIPELRRKLVAEDGRLQDNVSSLINGRNIRFLNGLKTEIKDGDIVAMFSPAAGGLSEGTYTAS